MNCCLAVDPQKYYMRIYKFQILTKNSTKFSSAGGCGVYGSGCLHPGLWLWTAGAVWCPRKWALPHRGVCGDRGWRRYRHHITVWVRGRHQREQDYSSSCKYQYSLYKLCVCAVRESNIILAIAFSVKW